MNRLALILLLAVTGGPVLATDPAETFDQGMTLLRQAQTEYTAELTTLQQQNDALILALKSQTAIIADLRQQLADCQAQLPPPVEVDPFYVFSGTTSQALRREIREAGGEVLILYGIHFDPGLTGTVDVDRLRLSARANLAEDFRGLVCLDMEGPYTRGLAAKIGSDEWNQTIEQMVLAADIVKEERPGALISYWGVPLSVWCWGWEDGGRKRWLECRPKTRQRVIDRWLAAKPLIERIDWFTPCAYDYYPVAHAPDGDAMCLDWLPFQAMVCKAMKPQAPILWSVSPRCHNALHADWDLSLLPPEEIYLDQIQPGLLHGDGVIWWGADEYYYGKGKIPADEIEPGLPWWKAWKEHFQNLHIGQREMFQRMIADPGGRDDG